MDRSADIELLEQYARNGSEEAFANLVSRHVDLVYSAAIRQVREPDLAEEVVQQVFILLARKASSLGRETIVAGWLYRTTRFVASEILRAQHRRRLREYKAIQAHEPPMDNSDWQEIAPLLDEAMARLNDSDRNLLLLRFFEKRSLREVGEAMGIKEDAAQKRVTRSLEKLRAFFSARGTVVPGAGLAAALSTFGVQAAPAGLASSVLAATSAAAIGGTFSTTSLLALNSMITLKQAALITTAVVAAFTVPTFVQWRTANALRTENEALRIENKQLVSKQQVLEQQLEDNRTVLAESAGDNSELATLRAEVSELRKAARLSHNNSPDPQNGLDAGSGRNVNPLIRLDRGRQLRKQGNDAEALKEFLWCFDEGSRDPAFAGVRVSFLLSEIADLAKTYPPARDALLSRRDSTEKAVLAGNASPSTAFELATLNGALGEPSRNLEVFDQLAADSPARGALVKAAPELFLEAKRYQDILESNDPETAFLQSLSAIAFSKSIAQTNSPIRKVQLESAILTASRGIEALAGAGQVKRAQALADKALQTVNTPEALDQLLRHAERSGNLELVDYLKAKQNAAAN